jgi:protein kinase C substrate 80K-H
MHALALYASLITHHNALRSLQREHKKHIEREKQLSDILDTLRSGYNPNYQDMAVLEAVRGWEHLAGLPHIGEAEREEGSDEEEGTTTQADNVEEGLEEGEWSALRLDQELDGLLNVDHISLLMEHEAHVDGSESDSPSEFSTEIESTLCKRLNLLTEHDIKAYLPDFLIPQFDVLRDSLVSWLQALGILTGTSSAASR